jgi:hypothetical protein
LSPADLLVRIRSQDQTGCVSRPLFTAPVIPVDKNYFSLLCAFLCT